MIRANPFALSPKVGLLICSSLALFASACSGSLEGDSTDALPSSSVSATDMPGLGSAAPSVPGSLVSEAQSSASAPGGGPTATTPGSGTTTAPSASGTPTNETEPKTSLPYATPTPASEALPARTWKLSHEQYAKSVRALVGVDVDVDELEPELDNGVYPNMSGSGLVRVPLATDYYAQAKAATDAMTTDALEALVPGGEVDAAAKEPFIESVVAQAFRRPATADEVESYGAIFDLGSSDGDVSLGFRSTLRAVLTSPYFLYRGELGDDATASEFTLNDYEVASLLSFSLLDAPPSAELLGAAERGELTNPTTLASTVTELLAPPEETTRLLTFASEWLKIYKFETALSVDVPPYPQKDSDRFPDFDNVRQAMFDESTTYLQEQAGPDGTLAALLTTPLPAPSGPLADFYSSEPSGAEGTVRTGVLALGTILSLRAKETSTSPTLRGLFVRDRLLCQDIHLPSMAPPDIIETQVRVMPKTTRELYEQHASQPSCKGCHSLLDSVGFNFEDLDAAGRFRSEENGVAINTSGELVNTDVDGPMPDHTALANALAKSEWVRECFARQAFRFYFGQVEADRGIAPVQAARVAIGSGSFRDAVAAVLSTPSTFQRVRQTTRDSQ